MYTPCKIKYSYIHKISVSYIVTSNTSYHKFISFQNKELKTYAQKMSHISNTGVNNSSLWRKKHCLLKNYIKIQNKKNEWKQKKHKNGYHTITYN